MISMSYSCRCGWRSAVLNDAQDHANSTFHHVDLHGFITPNKLPVANTQSIEEAARKRAKESAILRAARDKGLLK